MQFAVCRFADCHTQGCGKWAEQFWQLDGVYSSGEWDLNLRCWLASSFKQVEKCKIYIQIYTLSFCHCGAVDTSVDPQWWTPGSIPLQGGMLFRLVHWLRSVKYICKDVLHTSGRVAQWYNSQLWTNGTWFQTMVCHYTKLNQTSQVPAHPHLEIGRK